MQVGDLVWSLSRDQFDPKMIRSRRLAVITDIDLECLNSFKIYLCASGNTGRTSLKYLEPFKKKINLFS